ncbi:tRNA uridine-5-carboxymethylaminomethyl(34) synthesis GTPase MnmE [Salinisphaera sp. Q1T1-3]|uniref:tRNA uridine-5-carboxymethylaminomethyl(34) synthesis GTPase MnmE n=1 Tax=Salinisphaera sp. Q1T1-3 TaxID=2321229 RepID=UPI000E73B451|nr:tRNA uridine-5-carboxymethylaminomethyl(34) synthesis GTPase MnmE [Salinisphaera sp. Q1T1-3]RJS92570.1 tRNA uridine-5-carboxymethylaminomethyl(34) synthesis GTPase MnmE [Salinisphaera sp. Q1T1-3]
MHSPGADRQTIAALASAPGQAGVAVVRVSGPAVRAIAGALLGRCPPPRRAELAYFRDAAGQTIDQGLALYFAGPASFTGEDVLELHGHGSPVLVDLLLARLVELGARLAGPGEFSQRAFLNDKLSLDQAEAIADAIAAGSTVAARAAMRSLEGVFAREVDALVGALTALRVYTEAAIDFPDEEDVDFLADGQILGRLDALRDHLAALRDQAGQGAGFRDGLRLVILGRPNVGKSSLLNRLARRDTAIVTAIAGTTRDVLSERLSIDGLPLTLVDTAGLRETDDPVEAEGVRRARAEIAGADRALLVLDDAAGLTSEDAALLAELETSVGVTLIANKIDLSGASAGPCQLAGREALRVAAIDGRGFDELATHLKRLAGVDASGEPAFVARRRHLVALDAAATALEAARERLVVEAAGDLVAEELRQAQNALGEITGRVSSDDLLGEIFSSFCIGK